ncbi:MAG: hypothetical protein SF339_17040 [Blastocatellia bacterium]|nr:hypothetical protein [Blastocatellia bacterium]
MKRPFVFKSFVVFVISLFAIIATPVFVRAQGGEGKLTPAPKPTPAPKGGGAAKPAAKPAAPAVPATPTVVLNQALKARIDPKSSDKAPGGGLYEEFILNARADDWLNFKIESENTDLLVQVVDANKAEVAVARDAGPGTFKVNTQTGGLPADGEYRLRVMAAAGAPATPFTLTVNRLGLTTNVYNERFQKIYFSIRENEPATIDEAIAKLEELAKDDSARPTTFEQLGILYLYNKSDVEKAEKAMETAIKLNGAAVVRISFDSQWRRMGRLRNGRTDWEDARTGWLRIRPGQVALTDPSNKTLATVNGPQIKELANITAANYFLVMVTVEGSRRPFILAPGSKTRAEADLVVKLIQNHVMGKTN